MNALFTMQQATDECAVNYRTIQRWGIKGKYLQLNEKGNRSFHLKSIDNLLKSRERYIEKLMVF
jgi:hypothetical protein